MRRTKWRWWGLLFGCFVLSAMLLARWARPAASPGAMLPPLATPQVAEVADAFDYPLSPERFGRYAGRVAGMVSVDTRFGAQDPILGSAGKCFENHAGERIPFNQLYHAGVDWFALGRGGGMRLAAIRGEPVRAVAHGVVSAVIFTGQDGYVVIVEHALPDGERVWSVYWHLAELRVAEGQAVRRGEMLAEVYDQGLRSHLHWEIRTFGDGSALFPADSAGGRGACNGYVAGVGYTWDDDPVQAHPEFWGYLDPEAFVAARRVP